MADVLNINVSSNAPELLESVAERIEIGTASVAVVGLGDRGLHLLLAAAAAGYPVIGIDADRAPDPSLAGGPHVPPRGGRRRSRRACTRGFAGSPATALAADVVIMTATDGAPEVLIDEVAEGLRRGQLIIVDSLVDAHGADRVRGALETSGITDGIDFGLAVASGDGFGEPSEVAEISTSNEISTCDDTAELAEALYRRIGVAMSAVVWDAACSRSSVRASTRAEQLTVERMRQREDQRHGRDPRPQRGGRVGPDPSDDSLTGE